MTMLAEAQQEHGTSRPSERRPNVNSTALQVGKHKESEFVDLNTMLLQAPDIVERKVVSSGKGDS